MFLNRRINLFPLKQKRTPKRKSTIFTDEDKKRFMKDLEVKTQRLVNHPSLLSALSALFLTFFQKPASKVKTSSKLFKEVLYVSEDTRFWCNQLFPFLNFQFADFRTNDGKKQQRLILKNDSNVTLEKLFLAHERLEKLKTHKAFLFYSTKIQTEQEFNLILDSPDTPSEAEEKTRIRARLAKIAPEPVLGDAGFAKVKVKFGSNFFERAFLATDQLDSVLMWLSSETTSELVPKLDKGEWELVQNVEFGKKVLPIVDQVDYTDLKSSDSKKETLKNLGIWPGKGNLEIALKGSTDKEKELIGAL